MTTTATRPTTQTDMIDPALIDVAKDFNPRQSFDNEADKKLRESIKRHGVKQSLLVTNGENGRFNLVAGERRLRAAKAAKVDRVPVVIEEASTDTQMHALMENVARQNLNPIDEAKAITQILNTTKIAQKDLAATLAVTPSHITERKRLLTLPEAAQELIADGALPVASSRYLEKIAQGSQSLAAHFAKQLTEPAYENYRANPVRQGFKLLQEVSDNVAKDIEGLPRLQAIAILDHPLRPSSVLLDWPEEKADLQKAWRQHAAPENYDWDYAMPSPDAKDAMTSSSAIKIDEGGPHERATWVSCDREEIIDVIENAVLDYEQRLEKHAEARAKAAAEREKAGSEDARSQGTGSEKATTPDEPAGPSKHELREAAKQAAFIKNTEIGRNALTKLAELKPTLPLIKTLAIAYLHHNHQLAGAGIALTDERLQEVEVKEQKNGKKRTKVTYKSYGEASEILEDRVMRAKSIDEVLGLVFGAIVAGLNASTDVTLADDKRYWHSKTFNYPFTDAEKLASAQIQKLADRVVPKEEETKTAGKSNTAKAE